MDALETLDIFCRHRFIDQRRVYLTGHSMGGHGTWYLGALYPHRFAAIGPSAGWISFSSYGGSHQNHGYADTLDPFRWALMENDTFSLVKNYINLPIYIIHGEKDDNVPVEQSRRMVAKLKEFHRDFVYHEQPGAGHWWDGNPAPGAECVDWIPLFEFFRRHARQLLPLSIRFKTPNPAISGSNAWLTIENQVRPSEFSSISADADPRIGLIKVTTENVELLRLQLNELLPQNEATVEIDGTKLSAETKSPVFLRRVAKSQWEVAKQPSPWVKSSRRSGPFKLAFDKHMVWVYGTSGTEAENAAILAKVRYDAEVWWYRGNGNVEIVPDSEFDPVMFAGRNIILYGNADTNSAFDCLEDCPVEVGRDGVRVGKKTFHGDVGVYFVYPRSGSDENLVGVVGFTSAKATRVSFHARYFVSGVACPDFVVFDTGVLSGGMSGVLDAGYFSNEWKLPGS